MPMTTDPIEFIKLCSSEFEMIAKMTPCKILRYGGKTTGPLKAIANECKEAVAACNSFLDRAKDNEKEQVYND